MKRISIALALISPAALLTFFSRQPQYDLTADLPLLHFYVVTFATFSAAVVSILLISALGQVAQPRHVLAAAAFAVIGSLFVTAQAAVLGGSFPAPGTARRAWMPEQLRLFFVRRVCART